MHTFSPDTGYVLAPWSAMSTYSVKCRASVAPSRSEGRPLCVAWRDRLRPLAAFPCLPNGGYGAAGGDPPVPRGKHVENQALAGKELSHVEVLCESSVQLLSGRRMSRNVQLLASMLFP